MAKHHYNVTASCILHISINGLDWAVPYNWFHDGHQSGKNIFNPFNQPAGDSIVRLHRNSFRKSKFSVFQVYLTLGVVVIGSALTVETYGEVSVYYFIRSHLQTSSVISNEFLKSTLKIISDRFSCYWHRQKIMFANLLRFKTFLKHNVRN